VRVFENRILRRIFVPKRKELIGGSKIWIMRKLIVFTLCKNYYWQTKEVGLGGTCSRHGIDKKKRGPFNVMRETLPCPPSD
jgi:hypothetical protein